VCLLDVAVGSAEEGHHAVQPPDPGGWPDAAVPAWALRAGRSVSCCASKLGGAAGQVSADVDDDPGERDEGR
jgi:hypothetical protein